MYAFIAWVVVYGYYNVLFFSEVDFELEDVIEMFANLGISGTAQYYGLVIFYVNVAVGVGVLAGGLVASQGFLFGSLLIAIGYPLFEFSRAVEYGRSPGVYALMGLLAIFHSIGTLRHVSAGDVITGILGESDRPIEPPPKVNKRPF